MADMCALSPLFSPGKGGVRQELPHATLRYGLPLRALQRVGRQQSFGPGGESR